MASVGNIVIRSDEGARWRGRVAGELPQRLLHALFKWGGEREKFFAPRYFLNLIAGKRCGEMKFPIDCVTSWEGSLRSARMADYGDGGENF